MGKIHTDPEAVRLFVHHLAKYKADLFNSSFQIRAEFHQLQDVWADSQQIKYATEFEQAMKLINHFIGETEKQLPFLLKLAEKLEDYEQTRMN